MNPVPERVPEGRIALTYAEYAELPNDGRRYEILDGELAATPAPAPRHQGVSRNLQRILDRVTKAALYARFGIPHHWVLDPTERTFEVYELRGDVYHLAAKHSGAAHMRSPLFPALEIDLAAVWF